MSQDAPSKRGDLRGAWSRCPSREAQNLRSNPRGTLTSADNDERHDPVLEHPMEKGRYEVRDGKEEEVDRNEVDAESLADT